MCENYAKNVVLSLHTIWALENWAIAQDIRAFWEKTHFASESEPKKLLFISP